MTAVTTFTRSFGWQRAWIPQVREIVGPILLEEAPLEEDQQRVTDLIILKIRNQRIACRLRTPGYAKNNWYYEITVTCRRETGGPCEYPKMRQGWGDLFFYGHTTAVSPAAGVITPWWLVRLDRWREYDRSHPDIPELGPNKDATGTRCWFKAYDIRRLVTEYPDALLAGSEDLGWSVL